MCSVNPLVLNIAIWVIDITQNGRENTAFTLSFKRRRKESHNEAKEGKLSSILSKKRPIIGQKSSILSAEMKRKDTN
nr:hypothetical protein MACL_00003024 [Theileria orientalis]